MPRWGRKKVLRLSWRLLTVWMCNSPRTRSPFDWLSASWLPPRGGLAAETAQAVGLAPAHRRPAAVRTATRLAQALLERRRHRRSGLPAGQHRLELLALLRRQTVDLRQPRSKHPLIYRKPLSIHNKS